MFPFDTDLFCYAFGFSGFNEMKQVFRQHLMEETVLYRVGAFVQTEKCGFSGEPTPEKRRVKFEAIFNGECTGITTITGRLKNEQLDAAVNLLAKADNIYVIGLRHRLAY